MQRVWVWTWEMVLIPPPPSMPAGAEGEPHVAALGLQSLLPFHVCHTVCDSSLPATRLMWKEVLPFKYGLRENTNTIFN